MAGKQKKPIFPGGILDAQSVASKPIKDLKRVVPPNYDEYIVGLVDRISQRDHFENQLSKMTCLSNEKTRGFILSGPRCEWPRAFRFKMAYVLSVSPIDDRKRFPELKPLNADKGMADKPAEQYLLELLAIAMERSVKDDIATVLSEQNQCHIFFRELSNEESKNHEFLAGMLLGNFCERIYLVDESNRLFD